MAQEIFGEKVAKDLVDLGIRKPKAWEKKCSFPKCNEIATTTYCQIPLCTKHAEWAEFQRWFYYKLGL